MSTQLKERPIILTAEEINAVLAGDKTQHRLPVLTAKEIDEGFEWDFSAEGNSAICIKEIDDERQEVLLKPCPFGAEGDRLWVRETHHVPDFLHDYEQEELAQGLITRDDLGMSYKADAPHMTPADGGWTSPVAMPRWASRILLEITDIRIERVQDITHSDSVREAAFTFYPKQAVPPLSAFPRYWMEKHGDDAWRLNPWVWVIEFKKVNG